MTPDARGFALWRLGFRPFYLLASVFAALSAPLWSLEYAGWLPASYFHGPAWHAQEMLFGFVFAVIAGFLFTAVRNWTQQPTPTGWLLAAYALLWMAGRVATAATHGPLATALDAAFPLAVAAAIGVALWRSGNRRNYFFVALLALAAFAAVGPRLQVALDVVLFMVAVVGGRVIPMFTNNAIRGAGAARSPWVERVALASVLALLALDLLDGIEPVVGRGPIVAVAAIGAIAHAARLALWRPWRTLRTPMVWVLHVSYAWIVIHLVLRALAAMELVASPLATHALTMGAIGGMIIGMITRTARGHTGRTIAADRGETACFALVQLSALVRVGGGLFAPSLYVASVVASAFLWSAAFAIYAVSYWPVLTRPRVDGRPD